MIPALAPWSSSSFAFSWLRTVPSSGRTTIDCTGNLLCVCVCVLCVCVCCVCVCAYVCACGMCEYVHVYMCMCVCMHVCMCAVCIYRQPGTRAYVLVAIQWELNQSSLLLRNRLIGRDILAETQVWGETSKVATGSHAHLEVFHQRPSVDKAVVEEVEDGRALQRAFAECPPRSSAGLVVQCPPEKYGVY